MQEGTRMSMEKHMTISTEYKKRVRTIIAFRQLDLCLAWADWTRATNL